MNEYMYICTYVYALSVRKLTTDSSCVTTGLSFSGATAADAFGAVNSFCSDFGVAAVVVADVVALDGCLGLTAEETVRSFTFIFGVVSITSFDCCSWVTEGGWKVTS